MARRTRSLSFVILALLSLPVAAHAQELGVDYILTGSTSIAEGGTTQTFSYEVTNITDAPLPGIIVSDPIPADRDVVSVRVSQGAYDTAAGRWDVGELAAGATATLDITVTVPPPAEEPPAEEPGDDDAATTGGDGEELPFTGPTTGWFLLAGVAAVLLGAGFLRGARRYALNHFWRRF